MVDVWLVDLSVVDICVTIYVSITVVVRISSLVTAGAVPEAVSTPLSRVAVDRANMVESMVKCGSVSIEVFRMVEIKVVVSVTAVALTMF